jgi:SAM-dependent methyltransferase
MQALPLGLHHTHMRHPSLARPYAFKQLVAQAAAPYRRCGRFAWRWASGKLAGDTLFHTLVEQQLVPPAAHVLDLGCGQGLLAAWVLTAAEHALLPAPASWRGLDLNPRDIGHAQAAWGAHASFSCANICDTAFGKADLITVMDVLHYLPHAAQTQVLQRIAQALPAGGRLLLRVGDAEAGWAFRWSRWVDQLVILARSGRLCSLYPRSLPAWQQQLHALGFRVRALPRDGQRGFANVLLIADKLA